MQFVQSVPVAEVLATEGNIQVSRVCQRHGVSGRCFDLSAHFNPVLTELL